jgi:hypothetical protein
MIKKQVYETKKAFLTPTYKLCYEKILDTIINFGAKVELPSVDDDYIWDLLRAVVYDHPELFYIDFESTKAFSIYTHGTNIKESTSIEFSYWMDVPTFKALTLQVYYIGVTLCNQIKSLPIFEKELRIHDFLCNSIVYDDTASNSDNIIGALINKRAVCSGISKAAKFLFDLAQIQSMCLTGECSNYAKNEVMGLHAWNLVKLGRIWTHLDVTWDIPGTRNNHIGYAYFNLTNEDIATTHSLRKLPLINNKPLECDSYQVSYFYKYGLLVPDLEHLREILITGLRDKKTYYLIKLLGIKKIDNKSIVDKITDLIDELDEIQNYASYSVFHHDGQTVYQIYFNE